MPSILFEVKDSIAVITLNRPEKFNAFNREMALLLQEKLDECKDDDSIRCVYITGAGKAFSAGQDITEITGENSLGMNHILSEHYNPIVSRITHLEKPVVAAVNGVAAGAAANIALCCDVVVASTAASFVQAFSKIGLIPDSGGTYFLPRLIGWQKASALMMLAEKVDAVAAAQMGMIYRYFDEAVFEQEAMKIAATLAQMPTQALAYTKTALHWAFTHTLHEQLMNEDKLQQRAAQTEDFKEGLQAFLEKRKPNFKGK